MFKILKIMDLSKPYHINSLWLQRGHQPSRFTTLITSNMRSIICCAFCSIVDTFLIVQAPMMLLHK